MRQEIALLIVFLLVFLYDTFMPKKALGALSGFTTILFLLFTVASFIWGYTGNVDAFTGMYSTNAACSMIKNILNVGVLIVLIQSTRWADGELMIMRRGEFYELLLVTLFGMYLMISRATSCSSSSASSRHRYLSQPWWPLIRTAMRATRQPSSTC